MVSGVRRRGFNIYDLPVTGVVRNNIKFLALFRGKVFGLSRLLSFRCPLSDCYYCTCVLYLDITLGITPRVWMQVTQPNTYRNLGWLEMVVNFENLSL